MDFSFIQWFITDCSYYFSGQIILDLGSGIPFKLTFLHLTYPHYSSLLLFLVQHNVQGSFCNSPTPELEAAISPGSPGFVYCRNGFQKPRSGHCVYSLLLGPSTKLLDDISVYLYNNTILKQIYKIHIYIYIHTSVTTSLSNIYHPSYLSTFLSNKNQGSYSDTSNSNPIPQR